MLIPLVQAQPGKNMLTKLSVIVVFTLLSMLALSSVSLAKTTSANREEIKLIVVEEALAHGVDPALALAIAHVESYFDPYAVSHAGARGVMQIMPKTAQDVFDVHPGLLFDARTNVHLGVSFIKQLLDTYGREDIALSHYNGGSAVRDKKGRLRVIPATRSYVKKVKSKAKHYRFDINSYVAKVEQRQQQGHQLASKADGVEKTISAPVATLSESKGASYVAMQEKAKELREIRKKNLKLASVISSSVDPYLNAYKKEEPTPQYTSVAEQRRATVRRWESMYND